MSEFRPVTRDDLLRHPVIHANPKHQIMYENNRRHHIESVGETVECVAMLISGHSSLCFSPFADGKGSYACTCGDMKYTKARAIVALLAPTPQLTAEEKK